VEAERARYRAPKATLISLALALLLLSCCPVPTAGSRETAFTARVVTASAEGGEVLLENGMKVTLIFVGQSREPLAAGQRVYVEGALGDRSVLVERLQVLTLAADAH
jgi:hypothetical protein